MTGHGGKSGRPPQVENIGVGDYQAPFQWFQGARDGGGLVFLPALGMKASWYTPFCQDLADRGISVLLAELRGYGNSSLRASRQIDFGFSETLQRDLPAWVSEASRRTGGAVPVLCGHSLGGHLSLMYAGMNPGRFGRVCTIATASPWIGGFPMNMKLQVAVLIGLIPLTGIVLGYFPGHRIGFGGREARRLMADWRQMAVGNHYRAAGIAEDLDDRVGSWTGHVLSIGFSDDRLAPGGGIESVLSKLPSARIRTLTMDSEELGCPADHFRWARTSGAVSGVVAEWMQAAT